jgi:hypothetical protein
VVWLEQPVNTSFSLGIPPATGTKDIAQELLMVPYGDDPSLSTPRADGIRILREDYLGLGGLHWTK